MSAEASAPTEYTVLIVFEGPELNRFLMARHRERGWELPGGRVESEESWREAATREWREETGLSLARLEPLALHHRPDGSRGHLCLGHLGKEPGTAPTSGDTAHDEKVEEVRWVRRLTDVAPLAFPDDPYGKLARAVLKRRRGGHWRLPEGESEAVFVQRMAVHPEAAPKGHRVEPHPDAQ